MRRGARRPAATGSPVGSCAPYPGEPRPSRERETPHEVSLRPDPDASGDGTRPTIHQHPLAYLIGLAGVALMKAFAGEFDRAFTEARLAEVRALLDAGPALGRGVDVPPLDTAAGYDGWAPHYDSPENGMFAMEEHRVRPLLDSLPVGSVVDAACGTGRHAAYFVGSPLYPLVEWDVNDDFWYLATWRHSTVEYLRAALSAGFRVRDVHEPLRPGPRVDPEETRPPSSTRTGRRTCGSCTRGRPRRPTPPSATTPR